MHSEQKYIAINGVKLAYHETGSGNPVLLIHGFASLSYTWYGLIDRLPRDRKYITVDLKGFGHSQKIYEGGLSAFDQAALIRDFIVVKGLEKLTVIGHSIGGAIALICLFEPEIRRRAENLVLIDNAGYFRSLPDFIDELRSAIGKNILLKYVNEEMLAKMVLKQVYFDHNRITHETVMEYSNVLKQPNAKRCLLVAARNVTIGNLKYFQENLRLIKIPTLIIWGENDQILKLADAYQYQRDIEGALLKVIPACGHAPQEERPEITAEIIARFFKTGHTSETETPKSAAAIFPAANSMTDKMRMLSASFRLPQIRKIKMRRLIDTIDIGVFFLIFMIKILQFFKRLGLRASENGWRKITGVFLKGELAKFCLASFRLTYLSHFYGKEKIDLPLAKITLVKRLAEFLRQNPEVHWNLEWRYFHVRRKIQHFTDIIEAEFDNDGSLLAIIPYFDDSRKSFFFLTKADINAAINAIIKYYNEVRNYHYNARARRLAAKLRRWVVRQRNISYDAKQELHLFAERVLSGSFIHFEVLPNNQPQGKVRLDTPRFDLCKHPGSGILNIRCRFTENLQEADLWFQYHHVPVDGMPMQEMLDRLKSSWGSAGSIVFPDPDSPEAALEKNIIAEKQNIFQGRVYLNFQPMMKIRRQLNEKYSAEMNGPATIASMLIWGLAQHECFANRKFVFPVDLAELNSNGERELSLMFIRPGNYFNAQEQLGGFLNFEKEFNLRLFATRTKESESYELLEIYAMLTPFLFSASKHLLPKTLTNLIGSVGISCIRNADLFVCPLSDLLPEGFLAMGNCAIPTENGGKAGVITIRGKENQVKGYLQALREVSQNFNAYL